MCIINILSTFGSIGSIWSNDIMKEIIRNNMTYLRTSAVAVALWAGACWALIDVGEWCREPVATHGTCTLVVMLPWWPPLMFDGQCFWRPWPWAWDENTDVPCTVWYFVLWLWCWWCGCDVFTLCVLRERLGEAWPSLACVCGGARPVSICSG